ncbi:MAG TPA: metalloregulator ArsR/SmtB family transcription factor [Acidimicrobiales bacterium]|jgi:DNA-binding transcriptional ArsR family regulator|nr:metalloregulator ArsR/SmtB family transcription factor [Acidimicrobiales bacterium]
MEAELRAIASPRRREILRLVWDQERASGDIADHFDVSWPAISQNLRVLEDAGLVKTRRAGKSRLYRANRARLGPLKSLLLKMWEDDLDRLAGLAEAEAEGEGDAGRAR